MEIFAKLKYFAIDILFLQHFDLFRICRPITLSKSARFQGLNGFKLSSLAFSECNDIHTKKKTRRARMPPGFWRREISFSARFQLLLARDVRRVSPLLNSHTSKQGQPSDFRTGVWGGGRNYIGFCKRALQALTRVRSGEITVKLLFSIPAINHVFLIFNP